MSLVDRQLAADEGREAVVGRRQRSDRADDRVWVSPDGTCRTGARVAARGARDTGRTKALSILEPGQRCSEGWVRVAVQTVCVVGSDGQRRPGHGQLAGHKRREVE